MSTLAAGAPLPDSLTVSLLPERVCAKQPSLGACRCFWHVQHEFVEAEKRILGRSDLELTARAGYAGGSGAKDNKVWRWHEIPNASFARGVPLTAPQASRA